MWKKITLVSLCLAVVVGCGDKDAAQVKAIDNNAGEGKQQVAEQKSETAIYLPGGAGLDFGRKPVAVVESKWKDKDVITYAFEFDDATYDEVDGSISPILLSEGYARTEANDPRLIKYTTYKKGEAVVSISYTDNVREGFTKNLLLKVWWVK